MLKKILAVLLLTCITTQVCDNGCLKCNASNQCLVCDTSDKYFNLNGTCQKKNMSNCLVSNYNGDCLLCVPDYYVDSNTSNCVPVPQINLIVQCKFYSAPSTCTYCNPGYYVSGGACSAVTSSVANCALYSSATACFQCDQNYLLNAARTSCVAKPSTAGCGGFSHVQCATCRDAYYKDYNLYYDRSSPQALSSNDFQIATMQIINYGLITDWAKLPICVPSNAANCKIPTSLTACSVCNSGYFLVGTSCVQILASLPHCTTKKTINNDCILCDPGYYLDGSFACQQSSKPNCSTYVSNLNRCAQCSTTTYYPNSNGDCATRTKTNCATFDLTSDNCLTCPRTTTYFSSGTCSRGSDTACALFAVFADSCLQCTDSNTHYLSSGACTPRVNTNCAVFELLADKCVSCSDGLYLDGTSACVARGSYTCATYNNHDDSCISCAADYWKNGSSQCFQNTSTNCALKDLTANVCTTCLPTHFRNAGNTCDAYPSNCATLSASSAICDTCIAGYYNPIDGSCQQNTSDNCKSKNTGDNICDYCNSGSYRPSSGICTGYSGIEYCDAYNPTSNVCDSCMDNTISDGTTCAPDRLATNVAFCDVYGTNAVCEKCKPGYYLQSASSCVAVTPITNCQYYTENASSTVCRQCVPGYYVSGNACTARVASLAPITGCAALDSFADVCSSCTATFKLTDDGLACLAEVTDCSTYDPSTVADSALSCTACNTGYYLADSTTCTAGDASTYHCNAFASETTCASCLQDYYLSGTACVAHSNIDSNCSVKSITDKNKCDTCDFKFLKLTITTICTTESYIPNCATYNSGTPTQCDDCDSGYFLLANACVQLPPNCIHLDASEDCDRCAANYVLDTVTKDCFRGFYYAQKYCSTTNSGDLTYAKTDTNFAYCDTCRSGAEKIDLSNTYVCIEETFLDHVNLSVAGGNRVTHCKRYARSALGLPTCSECEPNFRLTDIFAAAPTCEDDNGACSGSKTLILDNWDGRAYGCGDLSTNIFCKVAIRINYDTNNKNNKDHFACLQAKATYAPAISTFHVDDATYVPYTVKTTSDTDVFNIVPLSLFYRGYGLTPIPEASVTVTSTFTNLSGETCYTYYSVDNTSYFCARTEPGFSILIDETTVTSTVVGLTADCDTSASYTGYPAFLSMILSCHKCSNSAHSLLTYLRTTDGISYRGISDMQNTWSCASISAIDAVPNCGVYGYISFDNTSTGTKCLSCLPGYKPLGYINQDLSIVSYCAEIDNCDTSDPSTNTLTNRCQTCNAGSGSTYYSHYDGTFQHCVPTSTDNCLFTAADSLLTPNTCQECKPGYRLNSSNECVPFNIPGCSDTVSKYGYDMPSTTNIWKYYIVEYYLGNRAVGCNSCILAGTLVSAGSAEEQCASTSSSIVDVDAANSYYVLDCLSYGYFGQANDFRCTSCITGKILNANGSKCVDAPTNCLTADSTDEAVCDVCDQTTVNVNKACVAPAINGCVTYGDSKSLTNQICTVCADGKSLAADAQSCADGSINNCKSYTQDSLTDCTACVTGYILISPSIGNKLCLQANSTPYNFAACTGFDATDNGSNGSNMKCSSCAAGNRLMTFTDFPTYADEPKNVCIQFNSAPGQCDDFFSHDTLMSNNSLQCSSCSNYSTHYYDDPNDTCQSRSPISNCAIYNSNADTCSSCNDDYFLDTAGTTCISFDTVVTVPHCQVYTAAVCSSCIAGYYLNGLVCAPVTTTIEFCYGYLDATTCGLCLPNYYLDNGTGKCIYSPISNCKVSVDANNCATCFPGYGVKNDGTNDVCVFIDLSNCATVDAPEAPFCSTCQNQYFLNANGICTAPTPIDDCQNYGSLTTCAKCAYPYFPVNSGAACARANIANCALYLSDTQCDICERPYVLSGDKLTCTLPSITSCASYDTATTCAVCTSGFLSASRDACNPSSAVTDCTTYWDKDTCSACPALKVLSSNACSDPAFITNCATYTSFYICSACSSSSPFWKTADGGACTANIIDGNCQTYSSSSDACATCNAGHYLSSNTCHAYTVSNCVTYSVTTDACLTCDTNANYMLYQNSCHLKTLITNCSTWSTPTTCSACTAGNYLVQNQCISQNTIANCVDYDTTTTCIRCQPTYALTVDKLTCSSAYTAFLESNCHDNHLVSTASCVACLPGFYFDGSNACVACNANTLPSNCRSCMPTGSACFLCLGGYHQLTNGSCILDGTSPTQNDSSSTPNGSGSTPTGGTNTNTNTNNNNNQNSSSNNNNQNTTAPATNSTSNATNDTASQNADNSTIKGSRIVESLKLALLCTSWLIFISI